MSFQNHTCDICQEIIAQLITPTVKWTNELGYINAEDINFGWLDSIITNTECSLCRLTRGLYEQTRPPGWTAEGRIYCTVEGGTTRLTEAGKRKDWAIRFSFFYPGSADAEAKPITSLWDPTFLLDVDSVPYLNLKDDAFQLAKIHPSTGLDFEFMKRCLSICQQDHGEKCKNLVRTKGSTRTFSLREDEALPPGMRLIDTLEDRIVDAPIGCSYVILSYVWGNTNFLRLLKNNLEEMTTMGALKHIQIPNTISNAIHVTKALGERYLWVDSLCIVQDDDDGEKALQIQNMDKIYSCATLTIVATNQTHADGGLWGLNPTKPRKYEQVIEKVGDLQFVGISPYLEDTILNKSPWIQRAWTYQEYILSCRYLFFSDFQVYFSCEETSYAEDYIHKVSRSGEVELGRNNDDELLGHVFAPSGYSVDWSIIVREYSKRSLSYESDGLNAVSGVLEHLAKGMQDSFICGLPVSTLFEVGLLWFASAPLRRRGPTTSRRLFPSWTWAGWVGEVRYEPFEDSSAILESRMIKMWCVEHEVGVLKSSALNFPSADGQMISSECSEEETQQAVELLRSIQTGTLCFEAMSACFTIDSAHWNQYILTDDYDCVYSGLYKIYNDGLWIGSVHLEHQTLKELGLGGEKVHEFIVLSKTGGNIKPHWVNSRPLKDDSEAIYLYSEDLTSDDENVYNVLLITEDKDETLRKGVGQIHKASFDSSNWRLKKVRLS